MLPLMLFCLCLSTFRVRTPCLGQAGQRLLFVGGSAAPPLSAARAAGSEATAMFRAGGVSWPHIHIKVWAACALPCAPMRSDAPAQTGPPCICAPFKSMRAQSLQLHANVPPCAQAHPSPQDVEEYAKLVDTPTQPCNHATMHPCKCTNPGCRGVRQAG